MRKVNVEFIKHHGTDICGDEQASPTTSGNSHITEGPAVPPLRHLLSKSEDL